MISVQSVSSFFSWPLFDAHTLLRGRVQDGRSSNQLLENLIALLQIRLLLILFLLAKRLEEGGNFGLEGRFFLAQSVEILGELLGEFGEAALDEEGGGRGWHSDIFNISTIEVIEGKKKVRK